LRAASGIVIEEEIKEMVTFRIRATVQKDRKLVIRLPRNAPTGELDVELRIQPCGSNGKAPKFRKKNGAYSQPGLLEWSRENIGHFGNEMRSDDVEGFTGRRF
jgi:hypothetical protein